MATKYVKRRICGMPTAKVAAANATLQRLDPAFGPNTFSVKAGIMKVCDIALTDSQFALLKTVTKKVKNGMVDVGKLGASHRFDKAIKVIDVSTVQIEE